MTDPQEQLTTSNQTALLHSEHSILSAQASLDFVWGLVSEGIHRVETLKTLPNYLHYNLYNQLAYEFNIMNQPSDDRVIHTSSNDPEPQKVPMDNIATATLKIQHPTLPIKSSQSIQLNQTETQSMRKIRLNTRRSNISKEQTEITSPRRKPRPVEIVKLPETPPTTTPDTEEEALVFKRMRKQKQLQEEKVKKDREEAEAKKKNLQEQQQKIEKEFTNGFTFDLDGSVLGSALVDTNKMNVHRLHLRINNMQKLRDRQNEVPQNKTIDFGDRGGKLTTRVSVTDASKTIQFTNAPIPVFVMKQTRGPNTHRRLSINSIEKRNSFRPFYESSFDVTREASANSKDKSLDNLSSNPERVRTISMTDRRPLIKSTMERPSKLVLPKLNGRYSVLDRYSLYGEEHSLNTSQIQ